MARAENCPLDSFQCQTGRAAVRAGEGAGRGYGDVQVMHAAMHIWRILRVGGGGALLFEQGRVTEAKIDYREDLGMGGCLSRATIQPDNVWSMKGLADCLKARGAKDTGEARLLAQRLDFALSRADGRLAANSRGAAMRHHAAASALFNSTRSSCRRRSAAIVLRRRNSATMAAPLSPLPHAARVLPLAIRKFAHGRGSFRV